MLKRLLAWLLRNAQFRLFLSDMPLGKRLGGHDVPGVPDKFLVLDIQLGGVVVFQGYFQAA